MDTKKYKIQYTKSSREDMKRIKKYIVDTFGYREYGRNFTKLMKNATESLKVFPKGFDVIGLQYRELDIHIKPYHTYLLFYIVNEKENIITILRVLKDGMDWKSVIRTWVAQRNYQ